MDFSFFNDFIILAKEKNFSEAADQLNISQSSLSRHIKNMENELGACLFERTSRKVKLSEFGKILLPYANKICSLQQSYSNDFKKEQAKNRSNISIATIYFVNDLIAKFHKYNQYIKISSAYMETAEEIEDLLSQGLCELAFIVDLDDYENKYIALPYETDQYAAILPISHPLAERKSLHLSELATEDFLSLKENTFNDKNLLSLCRKAGFNPNIVFRTDVGSSIAELVKEGMGVSLLQKKTLSKTHPSGITFVDIEPAINIDISLCYLKDSKLSDSAKCLIDYVQNVWPKTKAN